MDAYMSKPVRLEQLKASIDAWLRPTPTPTPISTSTPPSEAVISEAAATVAPPVDVRVLAELLGDDPEVVQEVLTAFRANTAQSALELERAQADGALQSMADITHKLKSAARAIGAARLGQICADIEEAAASTPRSTALLPLVAAFESELRAVHEFLDRRY